MLCATGNRRQHPHVQSDPIAECSGESSSPEQVVWYDIEDNKIKYDMILISPSETTCSCRCSCRCISHPFGKSVHTEL